MSKVYGSTWTSPFSASPVSPSSGSPVSPYSMPPLGEGGCSEPLTFKKVPCTQLTYGSAENDTASECGRVSRSPSLLTSLFTTQGKSASSSRSGSASASTSGTPMTPMSPASPASGCRPILRQGTPLSISPDDEGFVNAPSVEQITIVASTSPPTLAERRGTLKFAPCALKVTPVAYTKTVNGKKMARSPAPIATWADIPCALDMDMEAQSDEDDGYVEDEEDGLDSDFEAFTFSSHTSGSKWHSRFPGFSAFDHGSKVHPADMVSDDDVEVDVFPAADIAIVFERSAAPSRKISISIKGNCMDKPRCSKHLSPPPSDLFNSPCVSPLELGISQAPPPLLSPSATNFCRRRESGKVTRAPEGDYLTLGYSRGWRSDDGWKLRQASGGNQIQQARKMSLPEGKPLSILKCTAFANTPCPQVAAVNVGRRASIQA